MMKNKKKNIFHISCNLKATRPSSFDLFVVVATPREKKLMRAPKTKTDDVEKKKYVEKKQ